MAAEAALWQSWRRLATRIGGRLGSVRARATLAAVVVVGLALAVGALGLLSLLGRSLEEGVESSARTELVDIASLTTSGPLPTRLPVSRGDTFAQVVTADGHVLASSAGLSRAAPMTGLRPPSGTTTLVGRVPALAVREADVRQPDPDGPYLVVARVLTAAGGGAGTFRSGPLIVYVASSLRPAVQATTTVAIALAAGLPIFVLLVGALAWVLSGRALRPVEAIRAEVAALSARDLHRRVPEPASSDEVGRLARTMNAMLDRLEASAGRQRRFVADASHELRSPLTVIQATLEVALAHPEESSWPAVAGEALEEARRLERLVEDLLVLARADEGSLVPRRDVVDLDEVVMSEARRLRVGAMRVVPDLHRVSAGRVVGDRDQLRRVVHNLLDNAGRHACSAVSVDLHVVGDGVALTVADDGPGIPPGARDRVFDRFVRLDEARSLDDGGTGLGLAIVKEIVHLHGGTIEVADSVEGARFVVRLPVAEA